MKINMLKTNPTFKSVYLIEPDVLSPSTSVVQRFEKSDNNTKYLYSFFNPTGKNENVQYLKPCELVGIVNGQHPALVLTNDNYGNDALPYSKFKNKYKKELAEISKMDEPALKKKLTKDQLGAVEDEFKRLNDNPSGKTIPDNTIYRSSFVSYETVLKEEVERNFKNEKSVELLKMYEKFFKQVKIVTKTDLEAFSKKIVNYFGNFVRNI